MAVFASLKPNLNKVLVITGCWTIFQIVSYIITYYLIDDLIDLGKLEGNYAFWPDFIGNLVLGVVGGLLGSSLLIFKVNAGYKHRTFLSGIGRSIAYFVVAYVVLGGTIVFTLAFGYSLLNNDLPVALHSGWENILNNLNTQSFLASMIGSGFLVAGTQFMLQVNDKFGRGILWNLLKGKYYHPREEERIFMFLDLRSSTSIAEMLGNRMYFELLNEVYQDITAPIIDSRGDIHQYVGDEVVVTWPVQRGLTNNNCVRCFFRIDTLLRRNAAAYRDRFGISPTFKAGIHIGEATVGEIGVVKKDIVFLGDVLNTTSRIQAECNRYDVSLLVSSALLQRLPPCDTFTSDPIGEIQLRGKADALALYSVTRAAARQGPTG